MGKLTGKFKKLSKTKKIAAAVVVAVVVVGGCSVLNNKNKGADLGAMVTTMPVLQQDIMDSITLKAPLEGTDTIEVVSNLHYKVTQINVKEGDQVTKGQVLAVLDSKAMQDELQSAQEALDLAESQYKDSIKNDQIAYDKAMDELKNAEKQLERSKVLFDAGGVSKEQLEQSTQAYENAKRTVGLYEVDASGNVSGSAYNRQNIEAARNALARKKEAIEDGQIKSTIDGTVTRVNIKEGRFADETDDKKPMFVIENLDHLQMKVNVSEYDIARVQVGQPVVISADILGGDTVEGVVSRISPTGEQSTTGTERVIPTVIDVVSSNDKLIAGINAKAEIQIKEAKDVLVVPIEALVDNGDGQKQVYKVGENKIVQAIDVTTGVANDLNVEVQGDGLAAGDQVILSPQGIIDGMQVSVMGAM